MNNSFELELTNKLASTGCAGTEHRDDESGHASESQTHLNENIEEVTIDIDDSGDKD